MRRLLWLCLLLAFARGTVAQEIDNFRLDAQIGDAQPYVGQPIVYTVRFFSRQEAVDAQFIEPDFAGFGRSATRFPATSSTETIDGVPFIVTVQQIALIPLRPGEFTIEPFRVEIPETPFQEAAALETPPFTVMVQALPGDAPENYNNAIGQFEVEATVDSTETEVGEAITLSVTVTGTGNLEQITAPELVDLPPAWRSFAPETTLDQETPIFGSKTFRWTLIPTLNGPQVVPPISFTSFNPQTGRYETRQTSLLTIRVTGEPQPIVPTAIATITPIPEEQPPEITQSPQIEFLALKPIAPSAPYRLPGWFWLLWILPPLAFAAVWLLKHRQEAPPRPRSIGVRSRALQTARSQIEAASSLEPRAAYRRIAEAVLAYLSAKSGTEADGENLPQIPGHHRQPVETLLEEARSGQYAPITEADKADLIHRALQVIGELENTWKN